MSAVGMISVTAATGLLDAIAAAGGSAERVLRAARVERSNLARYDGFIPSTAFARLLEESAKATGDPCFGIHFGERFDPKDIGLLAYVVINSPTMASAMRNIERYVHIHNSAPRVSFAVEGGRGYLRYVLAVAPNGELRQHNEYSMAVLMKALRCLAGDTWKPHEVQLAHPALSTRDCERVFGCEVRFGCA